MRKKPKKAPVRVMTKRQVDGMLRSLEITWTLAVMNVGDKLRDDVRQACLEVINAMRGDDARKGTIKELFGIPGLDEHPAPPFENGSPCVSNDFRAAQDHAIALKGGV